MSSEIFRQEARFLRQTMHVRTRGSIYEQVIELSLRRFRIVDIADRGDPDLAVVVHFQSPRFLENPMDMRDAKHSLR